MEGKTGNMKTLFLCLTVLCCASLSAQELQVHLDREGELERIGRKLERDLRLFPGVSGFREARLFQLPDATFALEIYYRREGSLFKQRRLLPTSEVDDLRQRVSARILELRPRALQDLSGRPRFLVRTFLLSYGFYSWGIPVALDLEGRTAQVTALLTSSTGFLAPFWLTNRLPVSQTAASFSGHLGTTGIAHGVLLSELLFGEESSQREILALAVVGSMSGLAGGFALGHRSAMPAGTAEVIGLGGDYGLLLGLGSAHLAGILDEDHRRQIAAATLIGSGLGYLGGHSLARRQAYTRGDAQVLGTAGVLGAFAAAATIKLADVEEEKVYTAAAMAGSAAGVTLGHTRLRDLNFTTGEARMLLLGAFGGYLMGGAVGLIVAEDSDRAMVALVALGSLGGFWFTGRTIAEQARNPGESAWDIYLGPQSLIGFHSSPSALPLFTCRYRF